MNLEKTAAMRLLVALLLTYAGDIELRFLPCCAGANSGKRSAELCSRIRTRPPNSTGMQSQAPFGWSSSNGEPAVLSAQTGWSAPQQHLPPLLARGEIRANNEEWRALLPSYCGNANSATRV
jgi:hypothetical protein